MYNIFEMGDTLNYKQWAIKVEIIRLKKLNKHCPNSEHFEERQERIRTLELDLKNYVTDDE